MKTKIVILVEGGVVGGAYVTGEALPLNVEIVIVDLETADLGDDISVEVIPLEPIEHAPDSVQRAIE